MQPSSAAVVAVALAAAIAGQDGATILNSGSTNALGYKIVVWADGNASATLQNRLGTAMSSPKTFTVASNVAAQFFADLKAARDGNATQTHCMKRASFGTMTRVSWHGWLSPDLDCPPNGALTAALVHDVGVIRAASGADTMTPLRRSAAPPRR